MIPCNGLGDDQLENLQAKVMKKTLPFLLNTFLAGFFILLPFAFIVTVVLMAFTRVRGLADRLAQSQLEAIQVSPIVLTLVAAIILFLIFFITGLLVSYGAAGKGSTWLEEKFLNYVPGYLLIKGLANGLVGATTGEGIRPVLIQRFPGYGELGYVMEELDDGRYAVFVPFTPNVGTGKVWIVDGEKIEFVDARLMEVREALSLFGVGAGKILSPVNPKTK